MPLIKQDALLAFTRATCYWGVGNGQWKCGDVTLIRWETTVYYADYLVSDTCNIYNFTAVLNPKSDIFEYMYIIFYIFW